MLSANSFHVESYLGVITVGEHVYDCLVYVCAVVYDIISSMTSDIRKDHLYQRGANLTLTQMLKTQWILKT